VTRTTSLIAIVEDDEPIRKALRRLLRSAGMDVKCFPSGVEFLESLTTEWPDCVVLDLHMPVMNGFEVQAQLADLRVTIPVVIITGHGDVPVAVRAMKAGAVDFIEKPFEERSILDSLRQAQTRFAAQRASAQAGATAREKLATLTPREREVFDEMVRGKQNKMIAFDLDISPRTVEVHRARVLEKLEARSLSELVRLALAAGVPISS